MPLMGKDMTFIMLHANLAVENLEKLVSLVNHDCCVRKSYNHEVSKK